MSGAACCAVRSPTAAVNPSCKCEYSAYMQDGVFIEDTSVFVSVIYP